MLLLNQFHTQSLSERPALREPTANAFCKPAPSQNYTT
uniref:Uncharacterized protein n=1 Tax=Anguilla anguilla TaxID=7936 RepID=A0A0E9PEB0_ANGAN